MNVLSLDDVIELIEKHTPNLTSDDENAIEGQILDPQSDFADYAIRTCPCGTIIDGYHEYTDHIKDTLKRKAQE